jgi:hypothetical protein
MKTMLGFGGLSTAPECVGIKMKPGDPESGGQVAQAEFQTPDLSNTKQECQLPDHHGQ